MTEVLARRDGVLHIEDLALDQLADQWGTPLYVYSRAKLKANLELIKKGVRPLGADIRFAMKANSNRAILALLAQEGCGMEAVSGGEITRAVQAGVNPAKIIFSGVGKQDWEIDLALQTHIGQFNLESVAELDDILARVNALDRPVGIGVRLNPDVAAPTHDKIATGRAGDKFGIAVEDIASLVRRIRDHDHLDFKGLAVHIGSQISDMKAFKAAFDVLLRVMDDVGGTMPGVDLGGGMSVPYGKNDPLFDWAAFADVASTVARRADTVLIEPGRSICADAGVLVTRIIRCKELGRRFVIVDAAINDLMRPALYGARHNVECVRERIGSSCAYDMVGPVCESADTFGRDVPLVDPQSGDVLILCHAGAYAASMASNYNSRPLAAEILVDGRNMREIRQRQSIEDLMRLESPL